MPVYVDSSALVKLVAAEAETEALYAYLSAGDEQVFSSVLAEVEVGRAGRRVGKTDLARTTLGQITVVDLNDDILATAVTVDPPSLRTLDAIHLATALWLRDEVEAFVAYDRGLLEAAEASGLSVAAPA